MTSTPVKNPEILFRITANDTVVLVDLELEDFFWELDGLAGDLWKDIDGVKTWDTIKNLHRDSFNSEEGNFDQLSDDFLQELISSRIIHLK